MGRGSVGSAVLAIGIEACGGGAHEPVRTTDAASAITLHSEPTPTEPSGVALPTAEPERPHKLEECPGLAGARRSLELDRIRVKGIIVGGRSNVALMAGGRGRAQPVRVGEYVGSHCWKVASVGSEWVSLQREHTLDGPASDDANVRLYVNDDPRRDLAGR